MKKLFITFICLFFTSAAFAQMDVNSKGYRGFIEANVGLDVHYPAFSYGISTTHGYQFNRWIFLGAGAEYKRFVSGVVEHSLPIFADCKFYLRRMGFKPYIDVRAGYKLRLGVMDSGSLYAGGGLGFDVSRFTMRASFEYFKCERFNYRNGGFWVYPVYCISLNLGVNF